MGKEIGKGIKMNTIEAIAKRKSTRSYKPEQIAFVKNGHDGKEGQPWSIIKHLLYKNIFLETYENPETAEELALCRSHRIGKI